MKEVFAIEDLAFPVRLAKVKNNKFRLTYGKQVLDGLTYETAAKQLGFSILHALHCEGKIE